MFGNRILSLAVALVSFRLVVALPIGPGSPFMAPFRLLGVDEINVLESRSGSSSCSDLDVDDLQSLPGWPKLMTKAREWWGDGGYEIEINPGGYNDRPASMCVADPVLITPTAKPNCTHGRVDIPRRDGANSVEVLSGYANVGNWNITQVTTAAHGLFFQGDFRMPNMTTPPSGTYMNTQLHHLDTQGEFINAPFNSFVTLATNMTRRTETLTQVQDRTCIATISQQRCVVPGRGRIQLVATGYVWFKFPTRRPTRASPHGPRHRRYAVKLEDVLSVLDRSAWIHFNGTMKTTLRSDYFDECRWNFSL